MLELFYIYLMDMVPTVEPKLRILHGFQGTAMFSPTLATANEGSVVFNKPGGLLPCEQDISWYTFTPPEFRFGAFMDNVVRGEINLDTLQVVLNVGTHFIPVNERATMVAYHKAPSRKDDNSETTDHLPATPATTTTSASDVSSTGGSGGLGSGGPVIPNSQTTAAAETPKDQGGAGGDLGEAAPPTPPATPAPPAVDTLHVKEWINVIQSLPNLYFGITKEEMGPIIARLNALNIVKAVKVERVTLRKYLSNLGDNHPTVADDPGMARLFTIVQERVTTAEKAKANKLLKRRASTPRQLARNGRSGQVTPTAPVPLSTSTTSPRARRVAACPLPANWGRIPLTIRFPQLGQLQNLAELMYKYPENTDPGIVDAMCPGFQYGHNLDGKLHVCLDKIPNIGPMVASYASKMIAKGTLTGLNGSFFTQIFPGIGLEVEEGGRVVVHRGDLQPEYRAQQPELHNHYPGFEKHPIVFGAEMILNNPGQPTEFFTQRLPNFGFRVDDQGRIQVPGPPLVAMKTMATVGNTMVAEGSKVELFLAAFPNLGLFVSTDGLIHPPAEAENEVCAPGLLKLLPYPPWAKDLLLVLPASAPPAHETIQAVNNDTPAGPDIPVAQAKPSDLPNGVNPTVPDPDNPAGATPPSTDKSATSELVVEDKDPTSGAAVSDTAGKQGDKSATSELVVEDKDPTSGAAVSDTAGKQGEAVPVVDDGVDKSKTDKSATLEVVVADEDPTGGADAGKPATNGDMVEGHDRAGGDPVAHGARAEQATSPSKRKRSEEHDGAHDEDDDEPTTQNQPEGTATRISPRKRPSTDQVNPKPKVKAKAKKGSSKSKGKTGS